MSDNTPLPDHVLADRILRWLAIGGIVYAAYEVLLLLAITILQGSVTWQWRLFGSHPLNAMLRTGYLLAGPAPLFLLVGSVGLLRQRPWARSVLLLYAALHIGGQALTAMAYSIGTIMTFPAAATVRQLALNVIGSFGFAIGQLVVPALFVFCLTRPELIRRPRPSRGFEPLLPAPRSQP